MTDLPSSKTELRALLRRRRTEAAAALGAAASQALAVHAARLDPPHGAVVAGYWPVGSEMDPRPLMLALLARGCSLALPVVVAEGAALLFRPWSPGQVLEDGLHRTVQPPAGAGAVVPSLLLVPLLGFDARGYRLGQGGGYYDRTLAALRAGGAVRAVGLAYAAQEVGRVPAESWDQRLDIILTEQGEISLEPA